MENPRPEKVAVVTEVRERLDATDAVLLAEYRGLNVAKMAQLRGELRDVGGEIKVFKNTLVRIAARELDMDLDELLTGPTALTFVTEKPDGSAGDAVDVAKVLKTFGKDNPDLVVKGGLLRGKPLSADDAKALAELDSRDVVLAKLAGAIAAPMQQFAGLLQAVPRDFAYGLAALIEKGGGADAPAPADDAPAPTTDAADAADETPAAEAAADAAPEQTPEAESSADETPSEGDN